LNLIFIGNYETWAATLNTVVAYFVMGVSGYVLIKNSNEFRKLIRPFELLATIVLAGIIVFALRDFTWHWRLLVTAAILIGMLVWMRTRGRKMWNELNNLRHGISTH